MKIQFSNLVYCVLDLSDLFDYYYTKIRLFIILCLTRLIARFAYTQKRPIAAFCSWNCYIGTEDRDVTIYRNITVEMQRFYKYDKIQSVASAYRWITKFHPAATNLHLMYKSSGDLRVSHIDLLNDVETLTGQEIPDGDLAINTLPNTSICNRIYFSHAPSQIPPENSV